MSITTKIGYEDRRSNESILYFSRLYVSRPEKGQSSVCDGTSSLVLENKILQSLQLFKTHSTATKTSKTKSFKFLTWSMQQDNGLHIGFVFFKQYFRLLQ